MTLLCKGIRRRTTDVLDDYGQAHYLQNVRMKRVGEVGRRAGLGKSTMAQLAGPVQFMIAGWSNEPFIVNGTGGSVTGNADPLAYWTAATMRIPGGQVGQPAAPVIASIDPIPLNGPYPVGQVAFVATIVYDGLSGPLTYSWTNFQVAPGAPPTQIIDNANPGIFDFTVFSLPGLYSYAGIGGLTVTTALHGFSTTLAPSDYSVV